MPRFASLPGAAILAVLFGLLATSGWSQDNFSDKVTISPDDKNFLYVGRWDKQVPTDYHGNWIAAYVRTTFTGTSVGVKVGGDSHLVYEIDGQPPELANGGPGVVTLNKTPLLSGRHTLLVSTHGGGGWDFQGLVLDAGASVQAPTPRAVLEFVGDSITCGCPAPIEAAGNYSWLTAEALHCDHTQISWPGRALSDVRATRSVSTSNTFSRIAFTTVQKRRGIFPPTRPS